MSRNGALKVLNHALIGPEGKDNCHKFIDILGLRTIFPLFMKTPKKTKRTVSAEGIKKGRGMKRVPIIFDSMIYTTLHLELRFVTCNGAEENQARRCDPYDLRVQEQPLFLVCSSINIFTSMGLDP